MELGALPNKKRLPSKPRQPFRMRCIYYPTAPQVILLDSSLDAKLLSCRLWTANC